jgi:hypothetical protein
MNGNSQAQRLIGYSYATGQGVPRNYETAYFWSLVAARQGSGTARSNGEKARKKLTPAQIVRAEQRAAALMPGTPEQRQPHINFKAFSIRPDPVPGGGRFDLHVGFVALDPRVPYRHIPINFRYEIRTDQEVLLKSSLKTIQSRNGQPTSFSKSGITAANKKGRYTARVYLFYGKEVGKMTMKDFYIE